MTDLVFYSHFGDSEQAVEHPVTFGSVRLWLDSIRGDCDGGFAEYIRIEHSDPFRRALGVQDVPAPGALLLMGAGVAALALWKRRTIPSA